MAEAQGMRDRMVWKIASQKQKRGQSIQGFVSMTVLLFQQQLKSMEAHLFPNVIHQNLVLMRDRCL